MILQIKGGDRGIALPRSLLSPETTVLSSGFLVTESRMIKLLLLEPIYLFLPL
jgi:hypothetical protein